VLEEVKKEDDLYLKEFTHTFAPFKRGEEIPGESGSLAWDLSSLSSLSPNAQEVHPHYQPPRTVPQGSKKEHQGHGGFPRSFILRESALPHLRRREGEIYRESALSL